MTKCGKVIIIVAVLVVAAGICIKYLHQSEDYGIYEMDDALIYQGKIYNRYEIFEYDQIKEQLGKYVGEAKGNLDHPKKLEEKKDFTSVIDGEIYELTDYDSKKWLCIRPNDTNEVINRNVIIVYGSTDEKIDILEQ